MTTLIEKIILDSEFLSNMFDDKEDISRAELIELIPSITNHDLLFDYYNGKFNFSGDELLQLTEYLHFLKSGRLIDILLLIKYSGNSDDFRAVMPEYIRNEYDSINFSLDNIVVAGAYYNCVQLVNYYIEDYEGNLRSALTISVTNDNLDIFSLIVLYDDAIELDNNIYKIITSTNAFKILSYLIDVVEINDRDKNYLFASTCEHNNLEMARILLNSGVDVNYDDGEALRYALIHQNYELIKLLVDHHANIDLVIDLVRSQRDDRIIRLLRPHISLH